MTVEICCEWVGICCAGVGICCEGDTGGEVTVNMESEELEGGGTDSSCSTDGTDSIDT